MMNKSYLHPGNYYRNGAEQLIEWDVIRMGYDMDYRIFSWNGENLSEFDTGIPININSNNDYEENILRASNTYTIDADGDGLTDLISCQYNKSKSSKHNKYYDWRINFGARDGMGFGDSVDLDDASIPLSLMTCGAGIKVNFDKSGADVLLLETFPPYYIAKNPDGTGLYLVDDVKYYNTLEFPSGQPSGSSVDLKMRLDSFI